MNKTPNVHAVALGKLAVGFKKTMTAAAIAQRKAASKLGVEARKLKAKQKEKRNAN